MSKVKLASSLAALAGAALIAPAQADVVIDWNNQALNGIRATPLNPPRATRALAMMHLAVYDAVNGIEGGYKSYDVHWRGPSGASAEAAAATAAHKVLRSIFPARQAILDAALQASLDQIPPGTSRYQGEVWGRFCGDSILKLRRFDRSNDVVPYVPSGLPGRWRPTPPAFAPALLPNWPYVDPFAMTSGSQFRVGAPPALESKEYAAAYNEVKDYGDVDSKVRTEDQTVIAYFWEDGGGSVTPPGHWMIIAQALAEEFGNTLVDNARLFALLAIAQADGAIACWDNKYFYDITRPYWAIVDEADEDGNKETSEDPTWFSLIPTPPFPAYTSGHSTFSGGSARVLALFYGTDEIPYCGESPDPNRWPNVLPGVERCFDTLSQAAEEAGQSRIYGGIHWQYDNQNGLACGRTIADYVFANFLTPRCTADLDKSGNVDFTDLLRILSLWGPCDDCPEDLDGDDMVAFSDLVTVLSQWGSCK